MEENKYKNWVMTFGNGSVTSEELESFLRKYTEKYVFQLEVGDIAKQQHYQCAFILPIRKRKSTVLKEIAKGLSTTTNGITINQMLGTWEQNFLYCTKQETRDLDYGDVCTNVVEYKGEDLFMVDNRETRFPWQNSIIEKVLNKSESSVKSANDREIIWIFDPKGNSGKSKLIKWMCYNIPDVVKLSFGTSAQLRSALITIGPKKLYFIDVPRTLGEDDSLPSLMSVLEDLKNGFLVSIFYGKYSSLMIDPPLIVIVSNCVLDKKYLSKDRWSCYSIDSEFRLVSSEPDHPFSFLDNY